MAKRKTKDFTLRRRVEDEEEDRSGIVRVPTSEWFRTSDASVKTDVDRIANSTKYVSVKAQFEMEKKALGPMACRKIKQHYSSPFYDDYKDYHALPDSKER